MPNVSEMFPSKFLRSSDLKGKEPLLTIEKVEYEAVGLTREMKAVVYFKNVDKGLVLNKTNANRIVDNAGSALTEEWTGVQVRLYASTTTYQGEEVECVRIRPKATAPAARRPKPQAATPDEGGGGDLTDEDIPF